MDDNTIAKHTQDESFEDYSLDDLFKEDWNGTDEPKTNAIGVMLERTEVTKNQNSDPDHTLDEYFVEDWSYNPAATNQSMTNHNSGMSPIQKTSNNQDSTKRKMTPTSSTASISPITDMIEYQETSAFNKLLNSVYNLAALNDKGQTALHLIFYKKGWKLLDLLGVKFSYYPKTVNTIDFTDFEGLTHLHVACARGTLSLVQRYLSNNSNINARYNGGIHVPGSPLYHMVGPRKFYSGFSPLHFAIINPKEHQKEIVTELIRRGANVNATDWKGRTPFHIASRVLRREGKIKSDGLEIMDILLKSGCDVNAKDDEGNTPLLSVFCRRYYESVANVQGIYCGPSVHTSFYMPETKKKLQFLLERSADASAVNERNENALHLILENLKWYRYGFENAKYLFDDGDHIDMIKRLVSANPNVDCNLKSVEGETPLRMAVACMSPGIVRLLLDSGAVVEGLTFEAKGKEKQYFCYPDLVVIYEPMRDLIEVLDLLESRGFDLSFKDKIMVLKFLLHDTDDFCACRESSYEKDIYGNLKLLLHYGCDRHIEEVFHRLNGYFGLYEGPAYPDTVDVYNDDYLRGSEKLYCDLMEYLDTTRFGNIYCSKRVVEKVTEMIEQTLSRRFNPTFNHVVHVQKDLKRLKAIKFKNNVRLHDVLVKDPRDTPRSVVDDFDLKMIKNMRCYKDAVKGHITKARVRFLFEKYCGDCLRLICDSLPDVCYRKIAYYLNESDILKFILAATSDD